METEKIIVCNKFHCNYDFTNEPKIFNDLLLFQVGEMYCDTNARIGLHTHDNFFELTYVVSGKGVCYAGDEAIPIEKHDVFLSLPYEKHNIISDTVDPLRFYFIAFNFKDDSPYNKMLYSSHLTKLNPSLRINNTSEFVTIFPKLISQLETSSEYSDLKFELVAKVLCIDTIELFTNVKTHSYMSPVADNEQALSLRVLNYIDQNLTKINHLSDIADDLSYNYVYLSRIFKNKFGKSIHTYYSDKKLDVAKELLLSSSMSITEISSFLNYSSIFVFSRVFKSKFGKSPNYYKQKSKK